MATTKRKLFYKMLRTLGGDVPSFHLVTFRALIPIHFMEETLFTLSVKVTVCLDTANFVLCEIVGCTVIMLNLYSVEYSQQF